MEVRGLLVSELSGKMIAADQQLKNIYNEIFQKEKKNCV